MEVQGAKLWKTYPMDKSLTPGPEGFVGFCHILSAQHAALGSIHTYAAHHCFSDSETVIMTVPVHVWTDP